MHVVLINESSLNYRLKISIETIHSLITVVQIRRYTPLYEEKKLDEHPIYLTLFVYPQYVFKKQFKKGILNLEQQHETRRYHTMLLNYQIRNVQENLAFELHFHMDINPLCKSRPQCIQTCRPTLSDQIHKSSLKAAPFLGFWDLRQTLKMDPSIQLYAYKK